MLETFLKLLENFWHNLQSGQLPHLGFWNYPLLAVCVALEGPVATILGAVAASAGYMRLKWVFVAAAGGNLTADFFWYSLGRVGKIEWILKQGKRFGLQRQHLDTLQKDIQTHAPKVLVLAKLTAAFSIPTLIAAGLTRVPLRRWLPGYLAAESAWTGGLILIGYYTTETIVKLEQNLQHIVFIAALVFLGILLVLTRRVLQQNNALAKSLTHRDPPLKGN
jgi:membrane-associated protein